MAVNENVYGLSTEWTPAFFQQLQITDKNKIAYFGANSNTLNSAVTTGKLSYTQPIDNSLSYCGLGTESAFSHVAFFGYKDNQRKLLEYNDRTVTNFAFFEKDTSTNYTQAFSVNINQLDYICWTDNMNVSFNYTGDLSPLTVVNPHNIILYVEIEGKAQLSHSWTTASLSYIMGHRAELGWTYFRKVRIIPYFGSNIDNVSYSTTAGYSPVPSNYISLRMGILDEYKCTEKDVSFYMYGGVNTTNTVWGFPALSDISADTNLLNIAYVTEDDKPHLKIGSNNEGYIEYYEGMFENILKTLACFGLYFTGSDAVAAAGDLTNEAMYIGLIDEDGIGRGRYLQGAATAQAPQAAASYKDMHNTGYDPSSVDPTQYTNDTLFYSSQSSHAFTKMYILEGADVSSLANELYTAVSQAPQGEEIERYNQSVFLTQNPIDCIISLKKFPMGIGTLTPKVPMKLGSYQCTTQGRPLPYNTGVYTFTFSRNTNNGLKDWFGDSFLDYEQYTKVELTVPFCGTVEIPCCYMYEYDTIEVKLIVDFITGACTAYILSRGITIDSVSGDCAVNLPVNGIQSANLDSQIYSAAASRNKSALANGLGLIGGLAAIGIGIATGGIGTAVVGGIAALTSGANLVTQDKKIEYELQHMQLPLKQVSAASGAIAQSYDMRCKLRITRPVLDPSYDPDVYADTTGFACLMQGQVKDFSGLTVGEIDLDGVAAPETVKRMIQNLFAEGVYL